MKKYILSLVIFAIIICCNLQLSAQNCTEVQDKSIILQGPVNGPCAIYTARDNITLKTGFTLNGSKKNVQFKWDGGAGSYTPLLSIGGFTCSGNTLYGTYNLQDLYNSITKLHDNLISALGAGYTVNPATYGPNCVTMSIENLSDFIYSGIYTSDYVITPFLPANTSFTAKIDDNLWFPVSYLNSTEISDPENRQLNTSLTVGSTAGQASVSLTGGATYSIPIFSTPGTAGMQPSVSLVYNSQGGNGIAGYGWNIAGLSAITRVGQTIYHEAAVKGVDFNDDRFALDGQRLIKKAGVYGADKTEYYTEVFNGGKIISYGTTGAGPEWFEVIGKDGSIVEYGKVENARQTSQQDDQTTISWLINKITDPNGNYITFLYNKKPLEINIREILYTGNASTNPQITPYNSIKFYYSNRTDKSTAYIAGSCIEQSVILDHINLVAENEIIKTYKLKYYFDLYSKLNEIIENGRNNEQYNSTVFGYDESENAAVVKVPTNIIPFDSEILYGDFNGDGLSDIYYAEEPGLPHNNKWSVYLNDGNGNFNKSNPNWTGDLLERTYQSVVCDIDGNGLMDILMYEKWKSGIFNYSYNIKCLLNTGNGFEQYTLIDGGLQDNVQYTIYPADIDGDGKDEFFIHYPLNNSNSMDRIDCFKSIVNGNSITTNLLFTDWTPYETTVDKIKIIDINGDGCSDLMKTLSSNYTEITTYKVQAGNFIGTLIYNSQFPSLWHNVYPGDYNGDGKTDLLTRVKDANDIWHWSIAYWKGDGFVENEISGLAPYTDELGLGVNDFNNDGKTDIITYFSYLTWCSGSGQPCQTLGIKPLYCNNDNFYPGDIINVSEYPQYYQKVVSEGLYNRSMDFNGDGINDLVIVDTKYTHDLVLLNPNENKGGLLTIADGLNNMTQFQFSTLANTAIYSTTAPLTYPLRTIRYPFKVVTNHSVSDGLGSFSTTYYKYKDAILHLQGKGFLGFKEIETTSSVSSIYSVSKSVIDPTYYFMTPIEGLSYEYDDWMQRTDISNTSYINQIKTGYESTNKVFLPYQSSITSKDFISGTKSVTESSLDQWGNATNSKVSYYPTTTSTTPTANTQIIPSNFIYLNGFPSKPQDIQTTSLRTGQPDFTKRNLITYNAKGNVTKTIDFYGLPNQVTTGFSNFATVGLPLTTTISATGVNTRTSYVEYDSKYRFVLKTTNAEELTSSATYDPAFGNKLTVTDANGLTSTTEYNGFGMPLKSTNPEGVYANTELKWFAGTNKPNVLYYTESTSNNGPKAFTYFDKLGRELFSADENSKGIFVCTKSDYNIKGQLVSVSEPYFEGTSPTQYTTTLYDNYNRPQKITLPTTVEITYSNPLPSAPGLTSSITNSATTITTSKTMDATGKVVSATDPGGTITYSYYSNGNPKAITAPDGSQVTMSYDAYGRQDTLTDPDAGTISYVYNAFGELTDQTDAKLNHFAMVYDKLGRLVTKTYINDNTVTTNTYNTSTATNAKGLISSTTNTNGTSVSYIYDNLARLIQKTEHTDKDFNYFYTYDAKGNLYEYTYPSGFVIKNIYSSTNGSLVSIMDKAANKTIYVPGLTNARGQITDYTNAGGALCTTLQYDPYGLPTFIQTGLTAGGTSIQNLETQFDPQTGNLNYRKDKNIQIGIADLTENFTYDAVHKNRLATWQVNRQQQYTMTYADNNGNILTKSDLTSPDNPYIYTDITGIKPHAVKFIDAPLQPPAEALQTITYNKFNKVSEILHTNQSLMLTITYGTDEQRVKSEYYVNNVLNKTKYFVGGDYEVEVLPNLTERRTHYLPDGGLYVCDKNNVKIGMYYVLTDYQGNWYKVITETGSFVEQYSFDAWGKRRNSANWSYTAVPATFTFDRGYTGHEMLDAFGLINMNGRVYDPVVARFLSPDNYVQSPTSSQGFNRYSYCLNNPLTYTDPSGEFIPIIAIAAYIAMQGVIAGDMAKNSEMGFWGGFAMGAGTAALTMGVGAAIGPVMAGTGVIPGAVNMMVPAAISGGITYGVNAIATGQPFNWKGYGLSIGMAGVFGGVQGGYAAYQDENLNVWSGKQNRIGRGRFSIINTDKDINTVMVGNSYEPSYWVNEILYNPDREWNYYKNYGKVDKDGMSLFASKVYHYIMPNDEPTVINVSRLRGRSILELSGAVDEGYTVMYNYDGSSKPFTQVVGSTQAQQRLFIPDGVKSITIQYNGQSQFSNSNFSTRTPYRTKISGWVNFNKPWKN
jgi:RHS repeat-associated protein